MLPLLLMLLLPPPPSAAVASIKAHSSFSLDFFPGDGAIAQLALSGGAHATSGSGGAISMSSPHARVEYKKPITFAGRSPGFSTYFSFSLRPNKKSPNTSASLAFFLTPSAPNALAVVFAATSNASSHIRIDLAGDTAVQTAVLATPFARTPKLHSWIDYNATSATLQVRLSASRLPKPPTALLSCPLDLSTLLRRKAMRAGFTASSDAAANCSLFSWAFQAKHGPPYLMHSQPLDPSDLLTTPPTERLHRAPVRLRYRYPWGVAVSLLFAAACGAMLTFFILFVWYSVVARRPVAPVEYPMHPSDVVYEKIVLVGVKDDAATADDDVAAGSKK